VIVEVTGSQIRAARAFLKWSIADLAKHAGIASSTVQVIEGAAGVPHIKASGREGTSTWRAEQVATSLAKVTAALESAGITFLADDGKAGHGVRYRS
jgi:hypothetical protein